MLAEEDPFTLVQVRETPHTRLCPGFCAESFTVFGARRRRPADRSWTCRPRSHTGGSCRPHRRRWTTPKQTSSRYDWLPRSKSSRRVRTTDAPPPPPPPPLPAPPPATDAAPLALSQQDLDDMQATVDIAAKDPAKFGIGMDELQRRRSFVSQTRAEANSIRETAWSKRRLLAAARTATHRSKGLAAGPGRSLRHTRRALVACMPTRGRGCVPAPCPAQQESLRP